jgi:hypothetical protein
MIHDYQAISVFNPRLGRQKLGCIETDDLRLSNPRLPLPHTHGQGDVVGLSPELVRLETVKSPRGEFHVLLGSSEIGVDMDGRTILGEFHVSLACAEAGSAF